MLGAVTANSQRLTKSDYIKLQNTNNSQTPPSPGGAPDICAICATGANSAPKYIKNAWIIF